MWGAEIGDYHAYFKWPNKRMNMTAEMSLKSIEFKANGSILSSVRCTLTNGVSSPLFERAGATHGQPAIYNFDPKRKVCKVELSSNSNSADGSHVM